MTLPKSLAEKLASGECVHCDGGWVYDVDEETGEETASRCKCRRKGRELGARRISCVEIKGR